MKIDALTLQLLLERAQGLIDIVVANENLHKPTHLIDRKARTPQDVCAGDALSMAEHKQDNTGRHRILPDRPEEAAR